MDRALFLDSLVDLLFMNSNLERTRAIYSSVLKLLLRLRMTDIMLDSCMLECGIGNLFGFFFYSMALDLLNNFYLFPLLFDVIIIRANGYNWSCKNVSISSRRWCLVFSSLTIVRILLARMCCSSFDVLRMGRVNV